jgi:hypothetical protein
MVTQALNTGKEPDANPLPLLMQVTVDEVAHQLQIIRGLAYEIIHNRFAFHKGCA